MVAPSVPTKHVSPVGDRVGDEGVQFSGFFEYEEVAADLGIEADYFDFSGMMPSPVGVPFLSQSRVKRAIREPLLVSAWR